MAIVRKVSQSYRVAPQQSQQVAGNTDNWLRQQLPDDLGKCYSERLALDDDLAIVRLRYCPTHNLIEETASPHDRQMLVITFGMQGDSGYKGADGSAVPFRAGYTTATAFQVSQGDRCYEAGKTVSQLRLLIGESLLSKYIGTERARQLLGNGSLRQLAFEKTSAAASSHANALTHYLNQGVTSTLDMHIHTLSLLSEQLNTLAPTDSPQDLKFSAADIEKLDRVRDIMIEQMDQPLTLPYLCAAVGLNEFKLKAGMHYRFNSTPHRMLQEIRMRKAYTLLESGCQVAQAAYQVGYKFPNNFSAAFTRFFGKTPKSVFGRRR